MWRKEATLRRSGCLCTASRLSSSRLPFLSLASSVFFRGPAGEGLWHVQTSSPHFKSSWGFYKSSKTYYGAAQRKFHPIRLSEPTDWTPPRVNGGVSVDSGWCVSVGSLAVTQAPPRWGTLTVAGGRGQYMCGGRGSRRNLCIFALLLKRT